MIVIIDGYNVQVKHLRSLKIKKKRDSTGQLLVEGHRPIIDAIQRGIKPKQVVYSYRAMTAPLGAKLSDALFCGGGIDVEEATDSVVDSVSDTVNCQGVVAAFDKPSSSSLESFLESVALTSSKASRLILFLDGISDPGNLGTLIRSAYGFGIDGAMLVGDCCDPWAPKVVRASMGLCLSLPIIQLNWSEVENSISQDLLKHSQIIVADSASSSKESSEEGNQRHSILRYDTVDYTKDSIIIIGSEAHGVSSNVSKVFQESTRVSIPMVRDLESFNAAIAGSILISEAARQRFHSY